MSGQIFWKERAIITLTTTGASIAQGSGAAAGVDLDARSGGNAAGDMAAIFRLTCQFASAGGLAAGTIAGELYLVPKIDGTNLPQVDLTSGSSVISAVHYAGTFIMTKAPTINTDTIYDTAPIDIMPLLYTVHLINRGTTMSANWSLKVVTAQAQYT